MDKKKIRDSFRLAFSILFSILYLPAFVCYLTSGARKKIDADTERMMTKIPFRLSAGMRLIYFLHNNRYFRVLFYHRIGAVMAAAISWIRPGDRYLSISKTTTIGPGVLLAHPYATIINADRIGDNFSFIQTTTIGDINGKRPTIGNNVTLGAGVTIIGGVRVGDNVTIGAGSVVVKDIPSNSVAVGNPARVVRRLDSE